jgi:hypothetical protein
MFHHFTLAFQYLLPNPGMVACLETRRAAEVSGNRVTYLENYEFNLASLLQVFKQNRLKQKTLMVYSKWLQIQLCLEMINKRSKRIL